MIQKFLLDRFLLLALLISLQEASTKKIQCEHILELQFGCLGRHKNCWMDNKTSVNADGIRMSSYDDSIGSLYFANNHKIEFLPIDPSATFPRLIIYTATNCSLKSISYENFSFLKELKYLFLGHNNIEKIGSDTFGGLDSLVRLSLVNNKIKFLEGSTFTGLFSLKDLYLKSNDCIDKDFHGKNWDAESREAIELSCSYNYIPTTGQLDYDQNLIEYSSGTILFPNIFLFTFLSIKSIEILQ